MPAEQRLEALQATVMLLPDENCQVLQSLLLFLSDMAQHSDLNQVHWDSDAHILHCTTRSELRYLGVNIVG